MSKSGRFAVLWKQVIHDFFQRELLSILLWSCLGAIAAGVVRALVTDHSLDAFLIKTYLPPPDRFDEPRRYLPYLLTGAAAIAFFIAIKGWRIISTGFRSWAFGVTSGLRFISFFSILILLNITAYTLICRLTLDLLIVLTFLITACALRHFAIARNSRIPDESVIQVRRSTIDPATEPSTSDDAITTWKDDTLNRAPIVERLTGSILITRAPVVALYGDFGSGKTSVLNLLRNHLNGNAVVVSFSSWLPGSEDTLASYLMADIANECQKRYMVPGLRRSTARLASALAQTVPRLKGLADLLPTTTQRDDIESLRRALKLLPKRVVVLLDELDRMAAGELRTLLKVIRGISELPNLTFVCAAERATLEKLISQTLNDLSDLYFEKFFPVSIPLRNGEDDIRKAGTARIVTVLDDRKWFKDAPSKEAFQKELADIWIDLIRPFCRTLRGVGLLVNDVDIAANALPRELDSTDLVLIEVLRRFQPAVYELVADNYITLTGGDSWLRGGSYRSDEDKKQMGERLLKALREGTGNNEMTFDQVKNVLNELFPEFAKIDGRRTWQLAKRAMKRRKSDKCISNPDIFHAYFRHELPDAVYSSVAFEALVSRFASLTDDSARLNLLNDELSSMQKGSAKRDDFLKKLSDEVETADVDIAFALTSAALEAANRVQYEGFFFSLSEAGHILRMVIRSGERLPLGKRAAFLSECIEEAADDTMAFRIITGLTDPKSDAYSGVSFAELYPAFIGRMRERYGRDVDAANVDLTTSDPPSFNMWGMRNLSGVQPDPEDREIQHDFWKRYIGHSKTRLIRLFNEVFLPDKSVYTSDPEPFVENKISIELVRKLFTELPDDFDATALPFRYVNRLKRFLRGDFKNGISVEMIDEAGTLPEEAEQ